MLHSPLLSIIIPVYNAEKYLAELLDSIINQNYKYIEVIIINDGSTDNSTDIIQDYCNKYSYFITKNKINGGQSSARNEGLKLCNGEYITFIDADDVIEKETYENALNIFKENPSLEIVQFPTLFHWQSTKVFLLKEKEGIIDENQILSLWLSERITFSACDKIFKKEIFHDLLFPVGIIYEDMNLSCKIIPSIKYMAFSSAGCYKYRFNPTSTLNQPTSFFRTYSYLVAQSKIYSYCHNKEIPNTNCFHYLLRILNNVELSKISNYSNEEKKELLEIFDSFCPSLKEITKAFIIGKLGINGSSGIFTYLLIILSILRIKYLDLNCWKWKYQKYPL